MSLYIEVPSKNNNENNNIIIDLHRFAYIRKITQNQEYKIRFYFDKNNWVDVGFNLERERNELYDKIRELLVVYI